MQRFRILEDEATADIAFEAYGRSLEEMYQSAGYALFSIMIDLDKVKEQETDVFVIEAEDREALLLDFLNELLYKWDVDKVIFSDFSCDIETPDEGYRMAVEARGEIFDPDQHDVDVEIKAATYFSMEVEEEDGVWRGKVTLDI